MLELLRIKESHSQKEIRKVKEYMKMLNQNLRGIVQYKINLIKKKEQSVQNQVLSEELMSDSTRRELTLDRQDDCFYLVINKSYQNPMTKQFYNFQTLKSTLSSLLCLFNLH